MHRLGGHAFLPPRGSNTAGSLHRVHRLGARHEGPIPDRWHGHRPVYAATFRVVLERAHPALGGDRRDLRPALHRWDLPRLQLGTAYGSERAWSSDRTPVGHHRKRRRLHRVVETPAAATVDHLPAAPPGR